jgi:DNA primase large subunit
MAAEINQYSRQHKLNIEGIFDPNKKMFGRIGMKELNDATKNDNISHFICRLAYCRNDDLRRWFAT